MMLISSARRKGADHGACESRGEKGPATKGETKSKEAVNGFYFDRFTSKIKNHKKMAPRILEEKRLRELSKQTIERLRERRVAIAHQPQLDYLDLQL